MGRNPKGRVDANKSEHQCQPETKLTILAGVVTQCACGIVHRVSHKTVVEQPVSYVHDPQTTFDEWLDAQVVHAMQDLEADTYDLEADPNEDPDSGF